MRIKAQHVAILALVACGGAPTTPTAVTPVGPTQPATEPQETELDARFVEAVRGAAAHYREWDLLDEDLRQAPIPCAAPGGSGPLNIRRSVAGNGPHARKLYYLWASSRKAYAATSAVPVGFSVVKESFAAVAVDPERPGAPRWMTTPEGEHLTAGDRTDLFVMTKAAGVGTDAGWVYGTVAPDGTVTSAGRVATCMGCHVRDAKRERLFIVKVAKPLG